MKSKHFILLAFLIISILLPSCSKNNSAPVLEVIVPVEAPAPGIDEAMWDIYTGTPFLSMVFNFSELDRQALLQEWDNVNPYYNLTQEWTTGEEGFVFDTTLSTREHFPYTLAIISDLNSLQTETQMSQSKNEYIFLEYHPGQNTFSVRGAFIKNVRKNGFYETVEKTTMSKEAAENLLVEKFSSVGMESLPALHELSDDKLPKTKVRRYNHMSVNTDELYLGAFPEITLLEILSRFDDAYGELFKASPDSNIDAEHAIVSFDCYAEYDWLASAHLDEFADGTDNTQPYTYSAVYYVEDAEGVSLSARLDVFVEIEPKKQTLSLIESVFSVTHAGEKLFEDVHDIEETIVLLDTMVKYHPEDVVVTPTAEQVEELMEAEEVQQEADEIQQETEDITASVQEITE